jgi:hypothetical protein
MKKKMKNRQKRIVSHGGRQADGSATILRPRYLVALLMMVAVSGVLWMRRSALTSGAARTRGNTQSTVSAVGDSLEKLLFSEKVQTGKEVTDKRHPSSPEESTVVGPSAGVSGSLHPPTFDYGISMATQMSWGDFVSLPFTQVNKANLVFNQPDTSSLFICPDDIVKTLKRQKLSLEDIEWCKWALSPTGGKVQVGKSYGTLNKGERTKYDNFNCDEVLAGKNPSCDDVRRINPSLVCIYFISIVI